MVLINHKLSALSLAGAAVMSIALAACSGAPASGDTPVAAETMQPAALDDGDKPRLGLMSSLPLYWPLGAGFADLANGTVETPWQRIVLEEHNQIIPLDTLTPIPGLTSDAPETDPLKGLDRIAIIQPRGLSGADNVALDDWVRAGGHLLIALDPLLTGEYKIALGDPRRPTDSAVIPPVIARWGLTASFDGDQEDTVRYAELPDSVVPLLVAGEGQIAADGGATNGCTADPSHAIIRCEHIGKGTVTYVLDAAIFEHRELAGANGETINALLRYAFQG